MNHQTLHAHLKNANPVIFQLLTEAPSPRVARSFILAYIEELSRILHHAGERRRGLEWSLQIESLYAFREIISMRSETLTRYSCLRQLWLLANKKYDQLAPDLNEAFIEDLRHILLGMIGRSGIYKDVTLPAYAHLKNRQAAQARSIHLEDMARKSLQKMKRIRHGLEPEIIARRKANRRRLLAAWNAEESDWQDYRWHLRHLIRDSETLARFIQLSASERHAIDQAKRHRLPFAITPYYASLMDRASHRRLDHAVRSQVIPPPHYVEEMSKRRSDENDRLDFMLERDTSPVDLITRRYPHIAIFKPYNTCSQICVYCQRNWEIKDALMPHALAGTDKIKEAIRWLKRNPGIVEVLITGGDPLVLPDRRFLDLLEQVAAIRHIERIRIGSRTPVALPQRITDELVKGIAAFYEPGRREIAVITHFEHSYEITPESQEAVQKFRRAGLSVYNQAVFTIENSRRFELAALRRLLRLIGVDSYYTFNTKGKQETRDYRVPMARLQQEVKEEARMLPGLVRTDEPVYNVPGLGKNYVRASQHHTLLTVLPNGSRVYEFHPWEKNLSLVQTYIDVDVPILNYLQELEKRGEKRADYQSIWYYY
ncbi:MAG TPA: KamA family radical SAM protein [bacterium]|nr:KamA family radical SAM protein [bacterium]